MGYLSAFLAWLVNYQQYNFGNPVEVIFLYALPRGVILIALFFATDWVAQKGPSFVQKVSAFLFYVVRFFALAHELPCIEDAQLKKLQGHALDLLRADWARQVLSLNEAEVVIRREVKKTVRAYRIYRWALAKTRVQRMLLLIKIRWLEEDSQFFRLPVVSGGISYLAGNFANAEVC